ncbi:MULTISPECIES: sugar O-acetyltransferase [unclassified Blastococcus]|uniref:sugar O-acetyltransferase n=1 Tax=unclassified Blastococcus TaxID=2619396 RepID=UPI001EEFDFE4|nr:MULTISPECIES: sugar O-acetyltransferase [unclassified Blastococcus]
MRDRMLAGLPYRPDDPDLAADSRRAAALVSRYNAEADPHRRHALLAELLGAVGGGTTIRSDFRCDYGYRIRVGAHCFVNWGAVFLDVGPITLGDHVQLGPYVQLLTAVHPLDPAERRAGWQHAAPVTIDDNAWLGGGVVVLPGVTVGADTVVGAGAVVTADLPPGVVAVGNPARVVRTLV